LQNLINFFVKIGYFSISTGGERVNSLLKYHMEQMEWNPGDRVIPTEKYLSPRDVLGLLM